MTTLLEICQDAMAGVLNYSQPQSIVNNTDPVAVLLLSCASQVGRELERGYKWQALKKPTTITTVADQTAYDLPTDFRRFANLTFWSQSDRWPAIQVSNIGWRELQSGVVVSGIRFYFSVFGNKINIDPSPGDGNVIAYDYYSKQFCTDSNGTAQDDWQADSDLSRLDGDLMTLGVRAKFKARHGLPYAEEKGDYLAAITDLLADDTPKPIIDVGRVPNRQLPVNVPDGSWGI